MQLVTLVAPAPRPTQPPNASPPNASPPKRVFDSQLTLITFDQPQVTMIHFWGTWCGPCRDELPELAALHQEIKSHPGFRLLAITCASFDDPSLTTLANRTSQFYDSAQIDLPTYADPTTTARRQFVSLMQGQGMAYPTTILVDSQGIIRATWVGVPPGGVETIRKRVNELLADCP
jgi:thiol-disulfide isomerase/thioredoxin